MALPNNSDLAKYQISSQDWDIMLDIELVLSVSRKAGYGTYPDSDSAILSTGSACSTASNVW
jgi:hypothetical protein